MFDFDLHVLAIHNPLGSCLEGLRLRNQHGGTAHMSARSLGQIVHMLHNRLLPTIGRHVRQGPRLRVGGLDGGEHGRPLGPELADEFGAVDAVGADEGVVRVEDLEGLAADLAGSCQNWWLVEDDGRLWLQLIGEARVFDFLFVVGDADALHTWLEWL